MQTFKKLPITIPNKNMTMYMGISSGYIKCVVPFHARQTDGLLNYRVSGSIGWSKKIIQFTSYIFHAFLGVQTGRNPTLARFR
jgi:hypothetical protein